MKVQAIPFTPYDKPDIVDSAESNFGTVPKGSVDEEFVRPLTPPSKDEVKVWKNQCCQLGIYIILDMNH